MKKMSGIWPENHKQGIDFSRFSQTFCHKQGQGFKVQAVPPYPNLGQVPPWATALVYSVSLSHDIKHGCYNFRKHCSSNFFQHMHVHEISK